MTRKSQGYWSFTVIIIALSLVLLVGKRLLSGIGNAIGRYLQRKTSARRKAIFLQARREEKNYEFEQDSSSKLDDGWEKIEMYATGSAINGGLANNEWEGIVGFFHPFCYAGGGGERVLWAAIRATQKRWPGAVCVVYTGDHEATKDIIIQSVQHRFNIKLHPPTIEFIYLNTRYYVLSSTYPHFTLLGQSLGSLVLAYDAFSWLVPDIFMDTMGYAFALALSKFFFPQIPTGAYVHYPTISTDMLSSLDADDEKGLNAGTGRGLKGKLKRQYWHLFARMYGWVGSDIDVVMANSSWTQAHITSLWGAMRARRQKKSEVQVVFPPVAVEELEEVVEVSETSEAQRERILVYIAQFRPEKNQSLILRAFSQMLQSTNQDREYTEGAKLTLIGSVRDSKDETRVYDLRLLAHELKIKDSVEFVCDASWPEILNWLRKSWIGVNGMWNEHFGIGVVEYQAAGLICVVNDSGGPKEDIVIDCGSGPTGFHASSEKEYATAFAKVLSMAPQETLAMRQRARSSAKRFTEEAFSRNWVQQMEKLINIRESMLKPRETKSF